MRQITEWFEKHKVFRWLLGGVAVIGGMQAVGYWLMAQANPNTSTAHIFCSIVATRPDGRFDAVKANQELALSKQLAYEQGGEAGVRKARDLVGNVAAEYRFSFGQR